MVRSQITTPRVSCRALLVRGFSCEAERKVVVNIEEGVHSLGWKLLGLGFKGF